MSALANRRANTVRTFRSSSAVPWGDGNIHAGIGSPFFSQPTTHDARPTARPRAAATSSQGTQYPRLPTRKCSFAPAIVLDLATSLAAEVQSTLTSSHD